MKNVSWKYILLVLLSLVVLLTVAACGDTGEVDGGENTGEDAGEVVEGEEPAAEQPAGDVVASFNFNNTGSEDICELYLSPVGTESWGPDQLQGKTIPAGTTFALQNIPAGSYDAKAVGCAGNELVIQLDIQNP